MPDERCLVCGADCSKPPRAKDAQGRFLCVACYAQQKLTKAPLAAATAGASASAPPADDGLNPIPLAEEPGGQPLPEPHDPHTPESPLRSCPHCSVILPRQTLVCMRCGFNTQTGRNVGTGRGAMAGRACAKCGYDLEGLKLPRCPECGTLHSLGAKRDADRQTSDRVAQREYLKPAIMAGVGVLMAVFALPQAVNPQAAVLAFGLMLLFQSILGVFVYIAACMSGLDADCPFPLAVMRLVAAYTLFNGLWVVLLVLGVPGSMWIGLLILGILFTSLFDYDFQDGVILALVNMGLWMGIMLVLAWM